MIISNHPMISALADESVDIIAGVKEAQSDCQNGISATLDTHHSIAYRTAYNEGLISCKSNNMGSVHVISCY